MAKQTINIGTSANKGDGDPLRTAFDKVNDNFTEVYSDITRLNSVSFGGGTLTVDIIGDVFAHDSTQLVDAVNGRIIGPIESTTWSNANDITLISTSGDVELTANGTLLLQQQQGDDYITITNNGVVAYSDTKIQLKTAGQDIEIGLDTASGDTNIGHNSSTTRIYGTLDAKRFAKVEVPQYDNGGRSGIAPVAPDGSIIYNTDNRALEAKVDGSFVRISVTDLSQITDNTNIIPTDIGDLTDNNVRIKTDVSQLTDNNGRIPNSIGDLVTGGATGQVLTRTSTGYGFTTVLAAETLSLGILKLHLGLSADFDDFKARIAAL